MNIMKTAASPRLFLFIALIIALFATACASVSTMQTPGVVPQGEVRWAISSSAAGADGDVQASADPNFEASVRYGAAENLDMGLKINFAGAALGVKYQFLKGDFDLALGLEAGYQYVRTSGTDKPASHVVVGQIPLLMEYHFNPYVGLAFGPKILGLYNAEIDNEQKTTDADGNEITLKTNRADIWGNERSGLYVGLMVGLPLRLTEGIWFMPEINVYANAYDKAKDSFTNALWQASVSVFFGGL